MIDKLKHVWKLLVTEYVATCLMLYLTICTTETAYERNAWWITGIMIIASSMTFTWEYKKKCNV